MNSSIYSADRTTHLRDVALALVISIAIIGIGVSVRVDAIGLRQVVQHSSPVQKAEPVSREATLRFGPGRI